MYQEIQAYYRRCVSSLLGWSGDTEMEQGRSGCGEPLIRGREEHCFQLNGECDLVLYHTVFRIYNKYYNFNLSNRPPTSMTGAMGSELGRITFVFETLCSADCVLYFMVVSEREAFKGRFLSLAFSFKCQFIHASWDKNPIFLPILRSLQKVKKYLKKSLRNVQCSSQRKLVFLMGKTEQGGSGDWWKSGKNSFIKICHQPMKTLFW